MLERPSVPTTLDAAAEHLIIEIGAAVAQNLVESVPVAGSPRFAQRNVRNKDLLLVAACGTSHRPAGVADDQALAFERLTALRPDPVGTSDVDRI